MNLDKNSKQEQHTGASQANYDTAQNTSFNASDFSVKYYLSENQEDGKLQTNSKIKLLYKLYFSFKVISDHILNTLKISVIIL